jgi:hypothetical protein
MIFPISRATPKQNKVEKCLKLPHLTVFPINILHLNKTDQIFIKFKDDLKNDSINNQKQKFVFSTHIQQYLDIGRQENFPC